MANPELESALYWLSWIKLLGYISGALVVLGVAGQLVKDFIESPFEEIIEHARQQELVTLRSQTSNAQLESAKAQTRAAEANEHAKQAELRAVEANEKAEHERLERLKIEEKLAPRRFTPEQRKSVAKKLSQFAPPESVAIFCTKFDVEIVGFAEQIANICRIAGWDISLGTESPINRVVIGLAIDMNPNSASVNHDAALHLVNALRAERVIIEDPSIINPAGFWMGDIIAPIRIVVGEKP